MYSLTTSLLFNSLFFNPAEGSVEHSTNAEIKSTNVGRFEQLTLMHGVKFNTPIDITKYYVSEKLDGVRAYWDGKLLWSRQGLLIQAPSSLTSELPVMPLDGELWLGRGRFEEISGLVNRNDSTHEDWNKVSFAVFDVPYLTGTFNERYGALKALLPNPSKSSTAYPVFVVPQYNVETEEALFDYLNEVINLGGEGLMLHHKNNPYHFGRTNNVLKLKPKNIMRVKIVGYKPGNGKYQAMVGSLKVMSADGIEFYVGSGLTDRLRQSPPAIDSKICILHTGFTVHGKPRFPRYTHFCNTE